MITKEDINIMLAQLGQAYDIHADILRMALNNFDTCATISDKNATIKRLQDKLEAVALEASKAQKSADRLPLMESSRDEWRNLYFSKRDALLADITKLEAESARLHGHWHNAEETCNALRNQVDHLMKERDAWKEEAEVLQQWKDRALVVNTGWDEVAAYIRNHKDAYVGECIHVKCLEWLKQRDEIKAFLDSIPKI